MTGDDRSATATEIALDLRRASDELRDDIVYAAACVVAVQRAISARRSARYVRRLMATARRASERARETAFMLDVAIHAVFAAKSGDLGGPRN